MTKDDVNYIWSQSKRYKELMAIRAIAIQTRDYKKAIQCRDQAVDIQNELYSKYRIII